jgi:hypothetical protein
VLTNVEREQIKRLSQARTAPARMVELAQMIQIASERLSCPSLPNGWRAEKVVERWMVERGRVRIERFRRSQAIQLG